MFNFKTPIMRKKNQFIRSNQILELTQFNKTQAEILITKLRQKNDETVFFEVDCIPNGQLNAFYYDNGLISVKIIKDLAGSYLATDRAWLDQKIWSARNSELKTNFELGEEAGLWKRVEPSNYQEKINWGQPFCVKKENGLTKIWHPEWRILGYKNGFSTRKSIIEFIHGNPTYLQKFYLPLPTPNYPSKWRMFYRLVFLAEAGQKKIDYIGGLWISRPGFKIYPDQSSLIGLISPLTTGDDFG